MADDGPPKGVRVLDFCWIGAGALVTKALAELGADVIRIESRTRPDNLRLSPPFRPGTEGDLEGSGYFASRNPGKRSFALNMRNPEAREIALKLAARVDLVSSNFRVGVMERWGMSYEDVRAVNEAVVYLTMPMQGVEGPRSQFIGFGSTIAALSGLVYLSGDPDRLPIGTGTHYPDHAPNLGHALVATLATLYHRKRTGRGQMVELSQLESTVNVLGPAVLAHSLGIPVERSGDQMAGMVPRRAFVYSDDCWIVISCHSDAKWGALATALEHPEWIKDARFATVEARDANVADAEELVASVLAGKSRAEFLRRLDDAGVPCGPVNSSRDILEDPTLKTVWTGERVTMEGEIVEFAGGTFDFDIAPEHRPEVWVTGRGPHILRKAGELADGVLIGSFNNEGGIRYVKQLVERGMEVSGRSWDEVGLGAWFYVAILDSEDDPVPENIRRGVSHALWSSRGIITGLLDDLSDDSSDEFRSFMEDAPNEWSPAVMEELRSLIPRGLLDSLAVFGTVEQVAAKFIRLGELGVDHCVLWPFPREGEDVEDLATLLASEVFPLVRARRDRGTYRLVD